TTGDGGMLTTRDPDLDRKFRLLRQHAMSVPDTVRHGAESVIFEGYPEVGFNYRLTDVQAAVGSVQLRRLPEFLARRRGLAGRSAALRGGPRLRGPAAAVPLDDRRRAGLRHRPAEEPRGVRGEGVSDRRPGLNTARLVRLMRAAIEGCRIDLRGAVVFTEAAT